MDRTVYQAPWAGRDYCSPEMLALFSDSHKFPLWRKIWLELARAEQSLGVERITTDQLRAMEANLSLDEDDYRIAREEEVVRKHDVMAHVHAFGRRVPTAMPILHLGATSADITDNAELITHRDAARLVVRGAVRCVDALAQFAQGHRDLVCLGFTHLQPAQPTTVGRRAAAWIEKLQLSIRDLEHWIDFLPFRGMKGTTGTQGSFLELFGGDAEKVALLDEMLAAAFGFRESLIATGQTYPRVIDSQILHTLDELAETIHNIFLDVRLLAMRKEIEEPFDEGQVGSSAMPYKRNPMRSERGCSASRLVMSASSAAGMTAAMQMFERTLDDSMGRRVYIPQSFLAIDAALRLLENVASGFVVYPRVIAKNLALELPFMATEVIIAECVKHGGDRQVAHEKIRVHSREAGRRVKEEGAENDLLERIARDDYFVSVRDTLVTLTDPARFVGCAPSQVDRLLRAKVAPLLASYSHCLGGPPPTIKV